MRKQITFTGSLLERFVMLIQVRGTGLMLSTAHRNSVVEKIEAALERFCNRITKVDVFMADVNGPKNGVDKTLRIVIQVSRLPLIVVQEKGQDWNAILNRATDRAAYTFSRRNQRSRSKSSRTRSSAGSLPYELGESTLQ
jgi:ribosome-associated translation inhibitor RaiA